MLLSKGNMTVEEIAVVSRLSIEEVEELLVLLSQEAIPNNIEKHTNNKFNFFICPPGILYLTHLRSHCKYTFSLSFNF